MSIQESNRTLPLRIPMWKHQKRAFLKAQNMDNLALFFEQGTGKTLTCINILRSKYMAHNDLLRTLILAPPIVLENWKREFLANSYIDDKKIIVLSGSQLKRTEALKALKVTHSPVNRRYPKGAAGNELYHKENKSRVILITNYEALLMKDLMDDIYWW